MVKRTFDPHPIFDVPYLLDWLREREFKTSHCFRIYQGLVRLLVASDYCGDEPESVWEGIEGLPRELYTLLPQERPLGCFWDRDGGQRRLLEVLEARGARWR